MRRTCVNASSMTVTWFFVTRNSIGNIAFIIDGMPSPRQLT